MRVTKFICLFSILMLISTLAVAQQSTAQPPPTIKHVPISNTSPTSGKEMFNSYCAVCHGTDGKGAGPAAQALKAAPANLTTLTQSNGGKYPAAHVASVLRGQATLPSHGNADMPVWGPLFSNLSQGHEDMVQQRLANLVNYVETLQAK